jgi:hypothetical protein
VNLVLVLAVASAVWALLWLVLAWALWREDDVA